MSRDISNNHAPFAEVVGPDHAQPGQGGARPWPAIPAPDHGRPDGGGIPAGGVELKFRTSTKTITINVTEDGRVMVVYDVVNPPSGPKDDGSSGP